MPSTSGPANHHQSGTWLSIRVNMRFKFWPSILLLCHPTTTTVVTAYPRDYQACSSLSLWGRRSRLAERVLGKPRRPSARI
ncbi:hypothetical protein BCR44DRAFT_1430679 [Catenaria anguillulae PL171]|uniref:Uncharacterized protein n=1 Tax=Catenaria anguillulae PL171 TaxID=765915 RepID=A0A1Y2HRJ6_9FUNG|nr:hypothetical protein BCR44DRAFT_1430679 [Catenaria anguillulae PL171]